MEPIIFDRHLKNDTTDLEFSDNWDIIRYNNEMFSIDLGVEFVRQWLCIFATIGFSILFLKSICNLKRTQQGLDFDQLILITELIKVRTRRI